MLVAIRWAMIDFQELVQNVLDGSEDPLRAYAELKQYEKLIKSCLTEIWDIVDTEAAKEDKNFERYGFKFEKRAGGKMFNFKHLDRWTEAKSNLIDIEAFYKAAWQSKQNKMMSVSEEGEIIDLPIVTYRKDSIIVR